MATTGDKISTTWEGMEELIKKVANLKDLNNQRSLLFSIYSQSATPLLAPYRNALIELNDTKGARTPDRQYTTNQQDKYNRKIKPGDLKKTVQKIKSKGKYPAIYVGPRASVMRAGKKTIDGFYAQFIVFGFKTAGKQKRTNKKGKVKKYSKNRATVTPRTRLPQTLKASAGPTKVRISKKLKEKIESTWRK
jgi:hypothetical protein